MHLYNYNNNRSTPIECLHTILLGPYKYLLAELMERLKPEEKKRIEARIEDFPHSGLPHKLYPNSIVKHFKSLHGGDLKLLAQIALFILWDFLTRTEKSVWKALSKVVAQNPFIYTR